MTVMEIIEYSQRYICFHSITLTCGLKMCEMHTKSTKLIAEKSYVKNVLQKTFSIFYLQNIFGNNPTEYSTSNYFYDKDNIIIFAHAHTISSRLRVPGFPYKNLLIPVFRHYNFFFK